MDQADRVTTTLVRGRIRLKHSLPITCCFTVDTIATPQRAPDCHVKQLEEQLTTVTRKLDALKALLDVLPSKLPVDERPYDLLLQRLQKHEDDNIQTLIVEPMIRDLILIHDLLPSRNRAASSNLVVSIRESILELLSRYGVESFQASEHFDSKLQRCVSRKLTNTPSDDNTVAERIRVGFRRNDKVFRYEEVVVWRYDPQQSLTQGNGHEKNTSHRN